MTSDERAELAQLRRENRRLREDVEILKTAFFAFMPGDPVNVYPFIEAEQAGRRSVKRACELMQVSRSACYQHTRDRQSTRTRVDVQLTEQISAVHAASKGTYGTPRVHAELAAAGHRHGRKRIARLMRTAGLAGRCPRRWRTTTIPDPAAEARPDLIQRDFATNPAQVDTRWCGEASTSTRGRGGCTWPPSSIWPPAGSSAGRWPITYAPAGSTPPSPTPSSAAGPPRAWSFVPIAAGQYTSAQHARLAARHGVRLSVGRRGQCWDNAVAESFFATIKTELLHRQAWPTREAAPQAIFEYVEGWYDTRRRHSSLGYLSPAVYETTSLSPVLAKVA